VTREKGIYISIALIIILGFAAYANSLNGKFLWDDKSLVEDNHYIRGWAGLAKIFKENINQAEGRRFAFYRPIQMLTYALDYSIWRLDPKGYHLTNILLHILASLSLYWLINILFDNKLLSLYTTTLFLLHPIQTEAVSYISGRADPLAAIFVISSLILYIRYIRSNGAITYLAMLFSYVLALLSKEASIVLPVLLLLYHYVFKVKIKPKPFLSMMAITLIYLILRFTVLKPLLFHLEFTTIIIDRLPGLFVAITNYIRLLALPINLHMQYGNKLFSFAYPLAILGITILFLSLLLVIKYRRGEGLLLFSICWFFIALIPQSNLYPINAYMAEHWLYLPSIGFFLLLSKGLLLLGDGVARGNAPSPNNYISITMLIILLTFYLCLTIRQNRYWGEPIAFYERTLRYAPNSSRIYNNLGSAYNIAGRHQEAVEACKRAIELDPSKSGAYYNLGIAYSGLGRHDEAVALYERVLEDSPDSAEVYNNLGLSYSRKGERGEAVASYNKAIEADKNNAKAYYNLGNMRYDMGMYEEAIDLYKKSIDIDPTYGQVYNNLGNAYSEIGQDDKSIEMYAEALRINPDSAQAHNNIGIAYESIGETEKALASYEKAIELDPGLAEAYRNLGEAYHDMGRIEESKTYFNKAVELGYNEEYVADQR
jgi:tetratricopeptide (TPR) repeat protein